MGYSVRINEESFNFTYNTSKFFYDHIPKLTTEQGGLHEIDGKTGAQACEIIKDGLERIQSTRLKNWKSKTVGEPDFCALYDAPNGWGSTIGAILFLAQILAACAVNPQEIVQIH